MRALLLAALTVLSFATARCPGQDLSPATASSTLRKAVEFFRTRVSSHGGYLWRYSDDLSAREGENAVDAETIWVQPPGTLAVGQSFLTAYETTGEACYLDAARDAAMALVQGQLRSGGWTYRISFDLAKRAEFAYRTDPEHQRAFNVSTLDDNTTQAALQFLMRVDKTLEFKHEKIHEAAQFGLESMLKAQFPNGAWSQGFDSFPNPEKFPAKKARFSADWRQDARIKNYWNHYTLNDGLLRDLVGVLLEAGQIYTEKKYMQAAERAGDFLILAQLPEPQPAWAQQYNVEMIPVWARKFEPPALSGLESQGAMRALLMLYRETEQTRYLEPMPRALDYLNRSLLPDGRLARFYEMKTNKPLYFTQEYVVTYSDDDMPAHYSFKVASTLDDIAGDFEKVKTLPLEKLKSVRAKPKLTDAVTRDAQAALDSLDAQGRWVEDGKLKKSADVRRVIECRTFIKNCDALSRYLLASKP